MADCPKREFQGMLQYIDSLVYQSVPDYNFIHYIIASITKKFNIDPLEPLDWDEPNAYSGPTKADRDKRLRENIDNPVVVASNSNNTLDTNTRASAETIDNNITKDKKVEN